MRSCSAERPSPPKWRFLRESTTLPAALGSVLAFLAQPPVSWSLLVWIAPVPWLLLIKSPRFPCRWPYWSLWIAGTLYWLLTLHWIRLPHPLNYLGWALLATYLGVYLPAFVAISRTAIHRLHVPLFVAAPVVWTGLDWIRSHLFTGFLMGSLAHTQVKWPWVIQIADLVGEYGVTFLIMLVASTIAELIAPWILSREQSAPGSPMAVSPIARVASPFAAILALGFTLLYGMQQVEEFTVSRAARPGPRIALVQGNTLAVWKQDAERQDEIMDEQLEVTRQALDESLAKDGRRPDLFIWPETMFRQQLVVAARGYEPPPEYVHESVLVAAKSYLAEMASQVDSAFLVGIDRVVITPPARESDAGGNPPGYERYNSSVLVDRNGEIVGTYDKVHRVPFGEYIPFADWLPVFYDLTPLTGGIQAGADQHPLELEGVSYATNICYETTLPHVIRRQVLSSIREEATPPDVLVNLTNDAWFWGSSELDMHLACGVFRAVEMRTPLVVAANGGLSAHIDAAGKMLAVSQRQRAQPLVVDVALREHPHEYSSLYVYSGDWFATLCVVSSMALVVAGWWTRNKWSK